jgi:hypothetical protein
MVVVLKRLVVMPMLDAVSDLLPALEMEAAVEVEVSHPSNDHPQSLVPPAVTIPRPPPAEEAQIRNDMPADPNRFATNVANVPAALQHFVAVARLY